MARKPKSKWIKRTLKLKENHGWECRPGFKIFAADRGAVRFDIPDRWLIFPGDDGSIKFHDRKPPDDNCRLQMTVFYLNDQIDWSGLPLAQMLAGVLDKDDDEDQGHERTRGEIIEVQRERLDLAWTEVRFIDPEEKRPARSRIGLARWSNIQPILTFDFWESDAPRMIAAWDELVRTLVLGDYIEDPTQRVID